MPKEKHVKLLCVDNLRHSEYYGMQKIFDDLYARSKQGEHFSDLMDIVLARENILLAYRNIKANTGSETPGTDRLTIKDVGELSPEKSCRKGKVYHSRKTWLPAQASQTERNPEA